MKTNLLSSLCLSASLLALSLTASAQTAPSGTLQAACYPVQNSMKCRLLVDNPTGQAVSLVIRDRYGNVKHEETFRNLDKFNRAYDLAPLGDGTYTFEVSQGKTHWSQAFDVLTTEQHFVATSVKKVKEPRLKAAKDAPTLVSKQ